MKKKFNIDEIYADFPCLDQEVNGKKLCFLDSAASSQKPQIVIDTVLDIYQSKYANVHRGLYYLSDIATRKFEEVRDKVQKFIGAAKREEIIFTKGATEAINLVAHSYGNDFIKAGDEIIISQLEHHANIVPWFELCKRVGAKLQIVPITDSCDLDMAEFERLLSEKTAFVAITAMSNALGVVTDIKKIIKKTHQFGAKILVDACQAIVHQDINVQDLEADFLVFSGHKLYAPNGTGVLYGKYELLEKMSPYQMGGEMIEQVSFEKVTYQKPPFKFEAGTPVIAEIIALGAAIDYLEQFERKEIEQHEKELYKFALEEFSKLEKFTLLAKDSKNKNSIISFTHEVASPNDMGDLLDNYGIAVRAGHHCAQPLMKALGINSSTRASLGIYTREEDIIVFIEALKKVNKFF